MTAETSITERFADFSVSLKYEDLPAEVVRAAKHAILDLIGVALVGSHERSTRMVLESTIEDGNGGSSSIIGTPLVASSAAAALVNGYAAHALDYDDTYHEGKMHVSVAVLPAALVMSEAMHAPGKDLIAAYVAGYEISSRLGRVCSFGTHLSHRGVHATGFLGHFGALAAAGKLLGLDRPQMKRGLGITGTLAAGLVRSFGNMCYAMSAANAAQDAVVSARLAQRGFTGPDDILDGEGSIFAVHDGRTDPAQLLSRLGEQFGICGNTIKIYACAGWRNPIIEGVIHLSNIHKLSPQDVAAVRVFVWPELMRLPNYSEPRTSQEGKFSAEHAAAVALIDRAGGNEQFTDARVADPDLAAVRNKISVEGDERLGPWQTRIAIQTVDGRELVHAIPAQKGSPGSPLSWDEVKAKFDANAMTVLPRHQADRLAATIHELEALDDTAQLMQLCRRDA